MRRSLGADRAGDMDGFASPSSSARAEARERQQRAVNSLCALGPLPVPRHEKLPTMDIERINQIGSLLADLSTRTQQLRGYL